MFLEYWDMTLAFQPRDGDALAAAGDAFNGDLPGQVISMKNINELWGVVMFADGTAGMGDVTPTWWQGTSIAFGTSKALNVLETGRIWTKISTTNALGLAVAQWTKVTQATADDQYITTDTAEQAGIFACGPIYPQDFDTTNGYDCVRLTLEDAIDGGAAKLVCGLYIHKRVHVLPPENSVSVLAD